MYEEHYISAMKITIAQYLYRLRNMDESQNDSDQSVIILEREDKEKKESNL